MNELQTAPAVRTLLWFNATLAVLLYGALFLARVAGVEWGPFLVCIIVFTPCLAFLGDWVLFFKALERRQFKVAGLCLVMVGLVALQLRQIAIGLSSLGKHP